MRFILVGDAGSRRRLRQSLNGTAIDVVAEADTIEAARALPLTADGWLIDPDSLHRPPAPPIADMAEALTPRERQVLDLLSEGMPNKAIAKRLFISDQTVKFHVSSICGKLGAANRTEAVRIAARRGLIAL